MTATFKTRKCDICKTVACTVGVQAPDASGDYVTVYYTCQRCDPRYFERVAQAQKDEWLNGYDDM